MKVLFKQSVYLGGKDYKKGTSHEVPEVVIKHPYFVTMVKEGLVIEEDIPKKQSEALLIAKQKEFAEKVEAEAAALVAKDEELAESESEDEVEEPKAQNKKRKK